MDHGLDKKDHDEIEARITKIREARERLNKYRQRNPLTHAQLAEVLGDEGGMSSTSRVEDQRQRRKGGG